MQIEALLKTIPLFSDLDEQTIRHLLEVGAMLDAPARQVLYREGDSPDYLYVILAGSIRVYGLDEAGNEVTLRTMEAGAFFGELALLDRRPRSACIVTLSDCQFFTLSQTALMGLLQTAPPRALSHFLAALTAQVRNTTERYIREEQAKRAIQTEAEIARHRALAQMVAGVAHELNTPLGIANTAADIIENRLSSPAFGALRQQNRSLRDLFEDVEEAAQLVKRHLARAHKLVENFKRISVNQLTDALETVSLPELVAGVTDLFSINARTANLDIQLVNKLAADHQQWTGYPGYLTQVLLNLLSNIERYAYPDGKGGVVEITLAGEPSHKGSDFVLTVRDQGIGIAPADLAHIFDPFFTTGRCKGGAGLGMTIVHVLITEAMQGKIQITSTPGAGATVTLFLPTVVSQG